MPNSSTEARHAASAGLHSASDGDVFLRLLAAQANAVQAVGPALASLEVAADIAAGALRAGGKLAYVGAGSSGLMALSDCLELAGTFGIPPDRTPMLFAGGTAALLHMTGGVEDDLTQAAKDFAAAGLGAGDAALCLSASGTTPYTIEIVRMARAAGVVTVGFANVAGSPLLSATDHTVLLETGPEVVSGSTRMGAGTAQKVALNMLSVLVGIKLGHVHDGYMVNVVADNAKLRDRAARIVSAISETNLDVSRAALDATMGAVKPAVLVARGLDAATAARDLQKSGGHLAPLLDE